jgi:hypothetical protein
LPRVAQRVIADGAHVQQLNTLHNKTGSVIQALSTSERCQASAHAPQVNDRVM